MLPSDILAKDCGEDDTNAHFIDNHLMKASAKRNVIASK